MKHLRFAPILLTVVTVTIAMGQAAEPQQRDDSFGSDAAFLKKHTDAVVLKNGQAAVVVVPAYQGRVMTATAGGNQGASSGWINYELIKQGVLPKEQEKGLDQHMYAFGGEERFWLGPEGGQYSIYFAPGKPFEFADWFVPEPIDSEAWKVASQKKDEIVLTHSFDLQNHSGTKFKLAVERTVKLLPPRQAGKLLGTKIPSDLNMVAYQTVNAVTNKGDAAWKPETGLLSIWMLCMFRPSPTTTAFVPYRQGEESELGPVVNADYFGAVPPERLQVADGVIYFKTDGTERGKIGITPKRSLGVAGSYDPVAKRMTLLVYKPPKKYLGYVNSMWELQDEPYQGDAINSYNDGPVDDSGEQMGPFYELESSSPALALKPGQSGTHAQTIIHLYGDEEQLQSVLSALAPVKLSKVKTALK